MKIVSPALKTLLDTADKLCMMELFTITLTNGTVIRYTSGDYNINVGGNTFTPMTIESGECKQAIGLTVDELNINLYYNSADTIPGGATIPQAIRSGAFDYAIVQLEQVFMTSWSFVVSGDYSILIFAGRMDVPMAGRSKAEIKVKSFIEILNILLPRNVYQPGCMNTVYDSACEANRAAFAVSSTVTDGSTDAAINCGLSQTAGYFDQGAVIFTSGANVNVKRTVKSYNPGQIKLIKPLPYQPQTGDTFTIVPGCNGSIFTCNSKFNNLTHYRGTPFIPVPESVT